MQRPGSLPVRRADSPASVRPGAPQFLGRSLSGVGLAPTYRFGHGTLRTRGEARGVVVHMVVRVGLIGAGKMGLSHLAIVNAHPDTRVVAVCDPVGYVLSVLRKYTGVPTYKDYKKMIDEAGLDAVFVATPTSTHFECAKYALERGLHVFVEKPLTLSPEESKSLSELAVRNRRVNQVGFHNRFIDTFREARRLASGGALGTISTIHGSAFGQVVIREVGSTWRSKKSEGGGCLHDYACHVIDLMNFIVGPPTHVDGARLQKVFSKEIEDAVYAILGYANGMTGTVETNWSDETYRKMSTTVTLYGTKGKLVVDRQELKVYLRTSFEDYEEGWTLRYITDLQKPVAYYLRGEEYSAQVDSFVEAVKTGDMAHENTFSNAYETDRMIDLIIQANEAHA